jgi:multiple sugar transport system substrate-binding protein
MSARDRSFRVAVRAFEPFEEAIANEWRLFKETHGTELELDAVPLELHPLYESLLGNDGLRRGDWDVAFLSSDWFREARDHNAVVNLTPFLRESPPGDYPEGWATSLLDSQQFGDVTIGLPYHDGPECLIYRADLFNDPGTQSAYRDRHGRDLRPPRSWEEFHDVARFFNRPDQGLFGTAFAAYPDGHNTVYDFCLLVWSRGGELFDPDGDLQLLTEQAVEALTFYRNIVNDQKASHPDSRDFDSVRAGQAFANGELAMAINWFGFATVAATHQSSSVRGKVDIAAVPGLNEQGISLNSYWILAVAAGSPHVDTAYQFLRFCASPEMDRLLTKIGGTGCRTSTWRDLEINAAIPFYHRLESLHSVARSLPRREDWSTLASVIDTVVLAAINTDEAIHSILERYQAQIAHHNGDS